MDKGEIMNTVKETTLHPDGNEGVDLYPKTNINQVQELPQKLLDIDNSKLAKPTNPSAESAVTMLADGTVGTKLLSEIGGGGKLYMHKVTFTFDMGGSYYLFIDIPTNTNDDITVDFLRNYIQGYCAVSYYGALGKGAITLDCGPNYAQICGAVVDSGAVNAVYINYSNINGLLISRQTLIEL